MAKAIDPFEEYLRKKKVEMLEHQYRSQKERAKADTEAPPPPTAPSNDDPQVEARLKEEAADFFEGSQSAAAELFTKAATIGEDKVEEIKEALDEVFEEDEPRPEPAEDQGGTFVDFFRQVQEEFPSKRKRAAASPAEPVAPVETPAEETVVEAPPVSDFEAAAAEVSTDDGAAEEVSPRDSERLSLAEILLAKPDAVDLERKVEVLVRLVGKLAERSNLPESELIEALIKAGVEF